MRFTNPPEFRSWKCTIPRWENPGFSNSTRPEFPNLEKINSEQLPEYRFRRCFVGNKSGGGSQTGTDRNPNPPARNFWHFQLHHGDKTRGPLECDSGKFRETVRELSRARRNSDNELLSFVQSSTQSALMASERIEGIRETTSFASGYPDEPLAHQAVTSWPLVLEQ